MALIKYGGGVAGASGSVAGNTYSRNRAGAYIRNWAKPINPTTIPQANARARFGASSTGWGGLTKAQVDSWNAYANDLERINALGETYTPLGRQIFMEVNQNLQQVGVAMLSVPGPSGTKPSIDALTTLTATETAGVLTAMTATNPAVTIPSTGAAHFVVQAAPLHGPEKDNVNNQYRDIQIAGGNTDLSNLAVADYTAVFGTTAAPGQFLDIRYRVVDGDTGLSSSWVKGRAIVA